MKSHRSRSRAGGAQGLLFCAIIGTFHSANAELLRLEDIPSIHPGFRITGRPFQEGIAGYTRLSVSGAGDINGDGRADIIVGRAATASTDAHRAYVVFGKADSAPVNFTAASGLNGFMITSAGGAPLLGDNVCGAGDVNGDGLSDIVLGMATSGCYLVFGKANTQTVALSQLASGIGFRINFEESLHDHPWVSGAGDVNGDGLDDIIVSDFYATVNNTSNTGKAYVVFGKTTSETVSLASLGSGGFKILGDPALQGRTGTRVSGAGDVNGDGLSDVMVAAVLLGKAYIVFGKEFSTDVALANMGSQGFVVTDNDVTGRLGQHVSGAGDVNGDGLSDVLIGATQNGMNNSGEAYLIFGKSSSSAVDVSALSTEGFKMVGAANGQGVGSRVAGAGDINGDGRGDLLLGSYGIGNPGSILSVNYLLYGKSDVATINLGSLDTEGITIEGYTGNANARFEDISAAGDVNGDGSSDFVLVSNPNNYTDNGEIYVSFGLQSSSLSAVYRAIAKQDDAPEIEVGTVGNGTDHNSPSSRCWIDFHDGVGNGLSNSSLQTVTLNRSSVAVTNLVRKANVYWHVDTDRDAYSDFGVKFRYTDAEIAGRMESNLKLYFSSSVSGPWTALASTVDAARNTVSADTQNPGFFALAEVDQSGDTPTPSPSPSPSLTVSPSVSPSISPSLTVSPTASISPTPSVSPSVSPTPGGNRQHILDALLDFTNGLSSDDLNGDDIVDAGDVPLSHF
ncbi:MAG: VCBS repeat-containing protein [Candidatus Sumerlaeota bacterium]